MYKEELGYLQERLLQMTSKCWTNDVFSGRLNRWQLLQVFGLALLRSAWFLVSKDELNRSVQIRDGLLTTNRDLELFRMVDFNWSSLIAISEHERGKNRKLIKSSSNCFAVDWPVYAGQTNQVLQSEEKVQIGWFTHDNQLLNGTVLMQPVEQLLRLITLKR